MSFDTRLLAGVGVLAAVTEVGNFARASEMLGLTPSAVSRAVSRLEARVGVRLFDRNPREVSLTEEGRRFYEQVMPLLVGLEEAAAEAAGAAAVVRGRLRVSVDPWFARTALASKLQQFLLRHPFLSLDLLTSNYREEMMAGVDVAVRFWTCRTDHRSSRANCWKPASSRSRRRLIWRSMACRGRLMISFIMRRCCFVIRRRACLSLGNSSAPGRLVTAKVSGRLVMDDPSVAVSACVATVRASSKCLRSAWNPSCCAVSSCKFCRNGRKNFTHYMPIIRRATCRQQKSGHSSTSSGKLLVAYSPQLHRICVCLLQWRIKPSFRYRLLRTRSFQYVALARLMMAGTVGR